VGIGQYLTLKNNIAAYQIANAPKENHPEPIGFWLVGLPGTGKSRWARLKWGTSFDKDLFTPWFCGYKGEEAIILDDVDMSCKTNTFFLRLKRWADIYPLVGEVKGGSVQLKHKALVVTSNYTMEEIVGGCP
jgi:hypothetical protein